LQALGDKTAARTLAISVGVPVVPGTNKPLTGIQEAKDFVAEAGYPVMLKAAMGGGGRGMRVVRGCASTATHVCAHVHILPCIVPALKQPGKLGCFADTCASPTLECSNAMPCHVHALHLSVDSAVVPASASTTAPRAAMAFLVMAASAPRESAPSGGLGQHMLAHRELELEEAYTRASNEALSAFGNGSMFIEKYVEDPRHIEVQVLADSHGSVVHLYERDCSVQRRHQKVVEIAPAPELDGTVREALFRDAIKIAKKVNYVNAGTVEFMVDKHGKHYFLEVNPRIQVEHTVTEEITGVDIVQCQLKIAAGATLADCGIPEQAAIPPPVGFAVQCRVTCEDPSENFKPDNGRLEAYRVPGGPGIRLDGAVAAGNMISQYYDSLLTKVISHAPTYEEALRKLDRALSEFFVRGIKTNIDFVINVLRHPEFSSGQATTSFIERNADMLFAINDSSMMGQKLMNYLGDVVVNGPKHPGAIGAPSSRNDPVTPSFPHLEGKPLTGWRDVITSHGPDGWSKAVRGHKGLLVTDTTMRDAHQSLLATRMRTFDMMHAAAPTAQVLANAGSLEVWGGATFDVALRFLHECPWERLERLRERIPNIPFQMLLRGANAVGYTSYPDNVVRAFTAQAVKSGVDIFRVFDSLNYMDNLKFGMDAVDAAGGVVEGAICYSGTPTHLRHSERTPCACCPPASATSTLYMGVGTRGACLSPQPRATARARSLRPPTNSAVGHNSPC
jgi:pyruvate carboxylase